MFERLTGAARRAVVLAQERPDAQPRRPEIPVTHRQILVRAWVTARGPGCQPVERVQTGLQERIAVASVQAGRLERYAVPLVMRRSSVRFR